MERQERDSRPDGFREGVRQGLGVLFAFREAIEETIREARERGDLSADRAREVMKDALSRAQEAADEARERFDFVPRSEFDALRREVEDLRARVAGLEDSREGPQAGGETVP